jgi:hypothetical protein
MDRNYKNIPGIMFLLLLILSSCKKDENKWKSAGTIIGPDFRECACCGGYFIEIGDFTYNFDSWPSSAPIDLEHTTFPLQVNLDWSYDRECGGIRYITISRIEKRQRKPSD